jgi:hypothetical protein
MDYYQAKFLRSSGCISSTDMTDEPLSSTASISCPHFIFNWCNPFQTHYGPRVDSASNRNEYQKSSRGKGREARKADNLTAICEPIVSATWEPRCLTTLWACMACIEINLPLLYVHICLSCPSIHPSIGISQSARYSLGGLGRGHTRKLATTTQPQFSRNIADLKHATGFQNIRRTLRKLMFD